MGMIRNNFDGRGWTLAECTVLGRSPSCDIHLHTAEVSAAHAAIRWVDGRWKVVDLGSRNGTWVDERRLTRGEAVELEVGSLLRFGSARESWVLSSDRPPVAFLRAGEHERVIELGLLALPSPEYPLLEVMKSGDGTWLVNDWAGWRPAVDRNVYVVGGASWRLYLPSDLRITATGVGSAAMANAKLVIRHDRTEEHVTVELSPVLGPVVDLGNRVHHCVLLELARARLEDRATGTVEAEEGWIHRDDLARRLRLDVSHLNILVYRVRRQLAENEVVDGVSLIERRARSGLLRLGTGNVSVDRIE